MKIDVISFIIDGHPLNYSIPTNKSEIVSSLINTSSSDILLFPGWTIQESDINSFIKRISNKNITVFFENYNNINYSNEGFVFHKGKLLKLNIIQRFFEAKDINNNDKLIKHFLEELESNRIFELGNKKFLWLSCGENNILKNIQKEDNRVTFRSDNTKLKTQFFKLLDSVNIVINPIHTPMGNQGKIAKRRAFFSQNERVYLSTNNVIDNSKSTFKKLLNRKLQYVVKNQEELCPINQKMDLTKRYVVNTYTI